MFQTRETAESILESSEFMVRQLTRVRAQALISFAVLTTLCCSWGAYGKTAERTITVIHSFDGADGANPYSGVIADGAGNLYGTTNAGGVYNFGVVYKIDASGNETVLHHFTGKADGGFPYAGVIRDAAGNIYGTNDGITSYGVVYKLDPSGNETVLHSFSQADGSSPNSGLIGDAMGNLFGTTSDGGTVGLGTVYEIDATAHETTLYNFSGFPDGAYPDGRLIRDSAGNLYGTGYGGGTSSAGVVYKINRAGKESLLYSFPGGADGVGPISGLIRDSAGNLYGTTSEGGAAGRGLAFIIDPRGNETVLHMFAGREDGADPESTLTSEDAGNLYGGTVSGGIAGFGVVYKINIATREESLVHSFHGFDGSGVFGSLLLLNGDLYGTTNTGGKYDLGVVFKIALPRDHD